MIKSDIVGRLTCLTILQAIFLCMPTQANTIVSNYESRIRIKTTAYPDDPGSSIVPDFMIEDAGMSSEIKYDWNSWSEVANNTRFDISGWIEYGVPYSDRWRGGVRLFQDSAIQSRPVVLNEIYISTSMENTDIIVGRTIKRNTLSILYPLADRYVARDFNNPTDPKILGVWQARVDQYFGDWQYSISALPVFQPSKVPGIKSRWWARQVEPIIGQSIPTGATGRVERNTPDISLENTGILATIRTQQQGWDFFTSAYRGLSSYAVFSTSSPTPTDFVATAEYPRGFEWAAGVSTVFGSIEVHAESLYHHTESNDDDEYINSLVGCVWRPFMLSEWLHSDQVHIVVEYAKEHILTDQSAFNGYATSSKPFRIGKDSLFTECLIEITERNSAVVAYSQDFAEKNSIVQIGGGHRFPNGIRMELMTELFFGKNLYYGEWDNNDRIYLSVEYSY